MSQIKFRVNGISCTGMIFSTSVTVQVGSEMRSDVMLVDYLRNHLELRGTKVMCREAGCGACIVSAVTTPGGPVLSVNSCMVSVLSCHDWEITTIEKVGNRLNGYHPLQKTLADSNGTQCGHCSPGWIMAMYSLLKKEPNLTMLDIEKSFGSNVCRCTGYRPILEAFKKFAKDSPSPVLDIEDLNICKRTKKYCHSKICSHKGIKRGRNRNNEKVNIEDYVLGNEWCYVSDHIQINLKDNKTWYKVNDVNSVLDLISGKNMNSYMLLAGNTGKGAYPIVDYPDLIIDISEIEALKGYTIDQNLIIGAGVTLTNFLDILNMVAHEEYFTYLTKLYDHIKLVAHIPVRNIGTIGDNLMIKNQHREFPSDIFLTLETVGAQVTIKGRTSTQTATMREFLTTDMTGKVLMNVMLPPIPTGCELVTFKIMPRSQSATAIVNAGFLYHLDSDNKVLKARIAYGNLSKNFTRADVTETYLIGKPLFTNETIQGALGMLEKELVVVEMLPQASAAYRKQLALHLFYKGILTICPSNIVNPRFSSGVARLYEDRPVSKAIQVYDTNPLLWPLTQPIPKVEALIQCAGEAKYSEDIPTLPQEVFAAFVLSTEGSGVIDKIDTSKALKYPGVLEFFSAKDISGINSFTHTSYPLYTSYEEILCSGKVLYHNQPIGVIVAETQEIANKAAKLVVVTYTNIQRPVIDIKEAIKDVTRNVIHTVVPATSTPGSDIKRVIKGDFYSSSQNHFTMETIVCVTVPTEEGIKVYASTQWITGAQTTISEALEIDANRIDIHVRRIGGAYGLKISRSHQSIIACCLVTQKLNRPCRFIQPVTTTMKVMGKRCPGYTEYEVGVNASGEIQYCNLTMYQDNGCIIDEDFYSLSIDTINNCYKQEQWTCTFINTITDTASNTWCRAPGTLEAIASAEMLMERIAYECLLDPIDVRLANLDKEKYSDIQEIVTTLKTISDYYNRRAEIATFNASNRWAKRGLRVSLMRWTPKSVGIFVVNISVNLDGTVCISHGGIEMGQGIHTKVAQVCAYSLKIPLNKIQVKEASTISTPNSIFSGGSVSTESVCYAVKKCCTQLLTKLEPVKTLIGTLIWEEIIPKAIEMNIDLQVHDIFNSSTDFQSYNIFGAIAVEVEVDILTGEYVTKRVDLIEDVGQSVSPELDVGQVEGAFIMGAGHWTTEDVVYDPQTGELLTDRPFTYHVPLARDISGDFRIYFRKNSSGPENTFGSKAVGEPPLCMSVALLLAITEAVSSARSDTGVPTNQWIQMSNSYIFCIYDDYKFKGTIKSNSRLTTKTVDLELIYKGDAESVCMFSATKLEHLLLY